MKLKKLLLKNIRSYENQEILFPEGSLILAGDVGSGKTTILLAVEYALFGLQPGQKGSALLRNNSDSGEVILEFEIDDKNISIERKIKRTSRTVSNDSAAIIIDGKREESSLTEVKTKILETLGYPQEFLKKNNILYKYTVYTTQEQMKQIILDDSETRLNVLRHVFGIDKYRIIEENVKILISRLKEEIKFLQGEIKNLDIEKESVSKMALSLKEIDLKVKEQQEKHGDLVKLRKDIEKQVQELEEKTREKDVLESEIEKTKIIIAAKKDTISNLTKEEKEMLLVQEAIKEKFNPEELKKTLDSMSLEKKNLEKLNSDYINAISKINSLTQSERENKDKKDRVFNIRFCPTCLQDVPDNHKHNILNATEAALAEIKKNLLVLEKTREDLKTEIEKTKERIEALDKTKDKMLSLQTKLEYQEKAEKKIEEIKKQKEFIEKDILLLTKHAESIKEEILKFSKFDNILKTKREELKQAFITEKKSEISIAESRKEIELINKSLATIQESIKGKEKTRERMNNMSELQDWIGNQFLSLVSFTEKNVMMRLRKEFSRLFSKWFSMLAGESFEVQLDENFTPIIVQGGIEMEYSFLSGGERTAIALAYRLALNQTINSLLSNIKTRDLIMLDEPTEGFSETQVDKIRDVLAEMNISQIILVSHEQKIESFVDNIIKVKKENSISTISSQKNN